MPDLSFKDLCLDASDAQVLAAFWGRMLGRTISATDDGGHRVDPTTGAGDTDGIWVDPVPEPRTGKTRLHLDLRLAAADVTPLLDAGAVVIRSPDDDIAWWVLADPEGSQFCALPPAAPEWGLPGVDRPTAFELVVDAADARSQAQWWAARTGGSAHTRDGATFWWIEGAAGFPYLYWVFSEVPEPKTVKNRMHWDVVLRGTDVSRLVELGATLLRSPDDEIEWWVLTDPEGNEFCAFLPA